MDEWEEMDLVWSALHRLQREDAKWCSNFNVFDRMVFSERYRWWQLAKKQADKGLPSMQQLMLEVIKLRMKA